MQNLLFKIKRQKRKRVAIYQMLAVFKRQLLQLVLWWQYFILASKQCHWFGEINEHCHICIHCHPWPLAALDVSHTKQYTRCRLQTLIQMRQQQQEQQPATKLFVVVVVAAAVSFIIVAIFCCSFVYLFLIRLALI